MTRASSEERVAEQISLGVQKMELPLRAEIRLLRSLLYANPVCYIQTLSSFQAINPREPFVGYWLTDTTSCKRSSSKGTFETGFIMSYGGHHFTCSVWVGETVRQLAEVSASLGNEVADEALHQLVAHGHAVYFVRSDFPEQCPVYRLDKEQATDARKAGCKTEEDVPEGAKRKWREVQTGDQLVLLPPGGGWAKPMLVFPSDWLPQKWYCHI